MAKADVKNLDASAEALWRQAVARAFVAAMSFVGWSDKEASHRLGVDTAEYARWKTGERRPHLDRAFALAELREPLLVALARLEPRAEVTTEIRFTKAGVS